ncbi:MAG: hypothetical protein K9N49_05835, partial [Candidatus Marinimicrobia bacterium]|nr:hypothetical protein [Candidatus Neomarinimicrobiota bacterium]
AQRASFFLVRDLSGLDEAAVAEHQELLAKLTQAWKLSDQLQAGELEGDARRDAGRALFENLRELGPMMEAAREEEFYRIGRAVGYGPEEASAFVDYLNQVLEVTSGPRGLMGRQRGGAGGATERPAR